MTENCSELKPLNALRRLRQSPGTLAVILLPCLFSVLFALRDSAAPLLSIRTDRPALVFSSYMLHEGMDPVPVQQRYLQVFFFRNQGRQPVRIKEVIPSCGCLAPVVEPKEVPPGGTGRVTLPINTRNESPGFHEYLVTVKYDDPAPREVVLTSKVVLPEKQLVVTPRVLIRMGRISDADRDLITIADHRLQSGEAPLKITEVMSSSSIFSARFDGIRNEDGVCTNDLEVTYVGAIPAGQHKGVVTVRTNDVAYPVLQIPVVLGDRRRPADEEVTVSPESGRIIVDAVAVQSAASTLTFTVPSRWQLSHVETFPPQLAARISRTEPTDETSTQITVDVTLTDLPVRGLERGSVTLLARDGEEAEMVTAPMNITWK